MLFDAPSIGLRVRYLPVDLHYFMVEVPQVIHYNSTEGLCGKLAAGTIPPRAVSSKHIYLVVIIFALSPVTQYQS